MHGVRQSCIAWMALGTILFATATTANAQPAWVPSFEPGRRVHVVPPDYDPPNIGRAGLDRLDRALLALKYPFHIVVMRDLPAGPGDEDARARHVTDTLAETWSMRGADPATTSYFALTFEPRKFSMLAGARWKTELGLEGETLDPFIGRFLARVRGTPSDPAGGMADLAAALDANVFDRTDPERVAARRLETNRLLVARLREELRTSLAAPPEYLPWELTPWTRAETRLRELTEADDETLKQLDLQPLEVLVADLATQVENARAAAEKKRLNHEVAKRVLSQAIERLENALIDPDAPTQREPFVQALAAAKIALASDETETMLAGARAITPAAEPLFMHIENERAAFARRSEIISVVTTAVVIGSIVMGLWMLIRRRRRGLALMMLNSDLDALDEKLRNASGRYVEFYGKREGVVGLLDMEGRTGALLGTVTAEVDAIYMWVNAMEAHVARCRELANGAGYLDIKTIDAAAIKLRNPFDFDTGVLNEVDLFAPETKTITIDPSRFESDLDARFKASIEGWKRLEMAAELRFEEAATLFPHGPLDALVARCDAEAIPHRWLGDHPLFGDEASDQRVYALANDLKWKDALAFVEHVESLKSTEVAVAARTEELISARHRVIAARAAMDAVVVTDEQLGAVVNDAADDPVVAKTAAEAAFVTFSARLSQPPSGPVIAIETVLEAAEQVVKTCAEVVARREAVVFALNEGRRIVEVEAVQAIAASDGLLGLNRTAAHEAAKIHQLVHADGWLQLAGEKIDKARRSQAKALRLVGERRLVAAVRAARHAIDMVAQANESAKKVTEHIAELEAARAAYVGMVNGLEIRRQRHMSAISGYGGSAWLDVPELPPTRGPVDFVVLRTSLERTLDDWEAQERSARRAHEEAQRRQREAAEAARAAAARAAAAARSSSWSSSSSRSSSSSFRSSSSSSSSRSGSWGGSSSSSSSRGSSSRSGSW